VRWLIIGTNNFFDNQTLTDKHRLRLIDSKIKNMGWNLYYRRKRKTWFISLMQNGNVLSSWLSPLAAGRPYRLSWQRSSSTLLHTCHQSTFHTSPFHGALFGKLFPFLVTLLLSIYSLYYKKKFIEKLKNIKWRNMRPR
jgi:hypothetical protein